MHPIEFIEKNIRTYLLNEGFSQSVAQGGANAAVDFYRRSSQPTVKSKGIFEDCLCEAKLYARFSGEKPEKATKGKGNAKRSSGAGKVKNRPDEQNRGGLL
ncbi:hypothetical protein [Atlantibacter subterraneus]|uniref:hypothetical protein n=1 Tax=Atlantibacter subterraneus TaxID=255519 RepID=UPI0029655F85|nr:hypothetical protein [Atlantibacter subterranea]MDW2743675.1 hypothetical protein [Atlantibacter subterranea]